MKALLDKSKTLLAAFAVAVGLGGPALAQDNVVDADNVTEVSLEQYASLDTEQAAELSQGQIVLHFGEGFPEVTKAGIIQALELDNFDFEIADGGVAGHMNLFIDGQQGKRPFTPEEAVQFLLPILDANAAEFRVAQANIQNPTLEAG